MSAYKLLTPEEWEKFQQDKIFLGTPLDLRDGYIHLSGTLTQMDRVNIKYEPISNGDIYPHLYEALPLGKVRRL